MLLKSCIFKISFLHFIIYYGVKILKKIGELLVIMKNYVSGNITGTSNPMVWTYEPKKWRFTNLIQDKEAYINYISKCRSALSTYLPNKEIDIISSDNVGTFYRYVNNHLGYYF